MEKLPEIVGPIESVLNRFPAVQAAFLFGSRATDRARPDSDIDLALVGPASGLRQAKLDILQAFVEAGLERVDLVLLDEADPAMRFEAVRPNCLVYTRGDFDRGSYYSRTVREYFDLEPYLKIQRQALKRRWLDGAP